MATEANIRIYQGDDYAADVTVLNVDDTPADLTGYTAQSQIRISLADKSAAPVAEFLTTIAGNVITILLSHDQTKLLDKSTYVWDLQIIDPTNWITTLLAGQVLVTKEVTRVYAPASSRLAGVLR